MHGPTFMANPLACAAANASLDLFEREPKEGRVKADRGAAYATGWSPAARCLVSSMSASAAPSASSSSRKARTYTHSARGSWSKGVWVRPFKDIVYLMPPLVIGDDELDILMKAVRTVLNER